MALVFYMHFTEESRALIHTQFLLKKKIKEGPQRSMMALRIIMKCKTLSLGCDFDILQFPVFVLNLHPFLLPFFLINKQKHLNNTLSGYLNGSFG